MRVINRLSLAKRQLVASVTASLLLLLPFINIATARAIGEETAQTGLQISSLVINLNAEKGKTYNLNITVTNVTSNNLKVTSVANDFTTKDETGSPKILVDGLSSNDTYSLKNWVVSIPGFSLKPKESRSVPITIRVPKDAEAGGHYGVIRFNAAGSKGPGNVAVVLSTGVLVLTRVEGKIKENLSLKELFVTKKPEVNGGQLTIVTRLQNNGNVHVTPQGHLTIRNMFGSTVATYSFGGKDKNVLPQSVRRYEQTLDKKHMFGRYTVELDAGYGTNGQVLIAEQPFWIIPFKQIIIILAILIIAAIALRRLIKHYNAHIIKKARTKK